jgi:Raf kinase inhibitor-like YbhB/YbcL family protein
MILGFMTIASASDTPRRSCDDFADGAGTHDVRVELFPHATVASIMENDPAEPTIIVRSPAFGANGAIPIQFSADGDNVPPPLEWERIPEGTQSIAIIVEDPDAPTRVFTHWIVVGIPPAAGSFDAAIPPESVAYGKNDHGSLGWYGPNPASGQHRYFFKVFALDVNLDKEGMSKQDLYAAMKGHILARGELVGTFDKDFVAWRAKKPSAPGSHTRR